MTRPSLLLTDEPTGNLDSKTGETVIRTAVSVSTAEHNTTLVVVTHDHELAQPLPATAGDVSCRAAGGTDRHGGQVGGKLS